MKINKLTLQFTLFDLMGRESNALDLPLSPSGEAHAELKRNQIAPGIYYYKVFDKKNTFIAGKIIFE